MTTSQRIIADTSFIHAAADLGKVIQRLAADVSEATGIVPEFRPDAPDTHPALLAAAETMDQTGRLPIWDGASDDAIYEPGTNMLFRFWHDMGHLETGLSFVEDDERELQYAHHLAQVEAAGIERGSLPWRLYYADTVGQIEYGEVRGGFVSNQRLFAATYLIDPQRALETVR